MEAGGLDSAVCFGPGQLAHVSDDGLRREEPLTAERVVAIHDTGCCDCGSLDRSTQFLDTFQPLAQLDGIQPRAVDVTERGHPSRCPAHGTSSALADRLGLE